MPVIILRWGLRRGAAGVRGEEEHGRKGRRRETREQERQWRELAEDVLTGMQEWRLQHPKATWREIEAALDERWSRVRARMLQDLALASASDRPGRDRGGRAATVSDLRRAAWRRGGSRPGS